MRFDTVVIDPGHGGHDRGGVPGQRISEKALTLDTSIRLARILKEAGLKIVMTRTRDVFVSLPERSRLANKFRSAIFVSVHYNSAPRVGAAGLETYYYGSSAAALAARIQYRIVRKLRSEDRGVKRRGFYVLRNTKIPAVLVECGFLTNPSEGKRALTTKYRDDIAREIATAILSMR